MSSILRVRHIMRQLRIILYKNWMLSWSVEHLLAFCLFSVLSPVWMLSFFLFLMRHCMCSYYYKDVCLKWSGFCSAYWRSFVFNTRCFHGRNGCYLLWQRYCFWGRFVTPLSYVFRFILVSIVLVLMVSVFLVISLVVIPGKKIIHVSMSQSVVAWNTVYNK